MPILDMTVYDALKEAAGADFILELMETFFEDAYKQMEQMKTALSAQDAETFRRAAHSLKSNAATFGAMELSGLARELEMMGRDQNFEVGTRLEAVSEAFESVKAQLVALR